MKKKILSVISLLLCLMMLGSLLAACTPGSDGSEESTSKENTETDRVTEGSDTAESEQSSAKPDETRETESKQTEQSEASETESETETQSPTPQLTGPFADSIENAALLKNGVQAYYMDAGRDNYGFYNQNMSLEYSLNTPKVTALKNSKGDTYLENTMEVFLKMTSGMTYYASDSSTAARPNIYRYGYYYYDIHFLDQNFAGTAEISAEKSFPMRNFQSRSAGVQKVTHRDGVMSVTIGGDDPYVYGNVIKFPADEFDALQVTIKSTHASMAQFYFIAGSATGHNEKQNVRFNLSNDGEFHTYTIAISSVEDYVDTVSRIRLDFEGCSEGEIVEVKDFKAVKLASEVPTIVLDRNFHTYSDKMNQVLHFIAQKTTTGIAEVGMNTTLAADTVSKLIVKDASGLHELLDEVDWTTAEYVGFDVKNAGIFGYILLPHENSGKLTVTLEDGNYIITQASTPKNGTIEAIGTYTENDYYMGHRIYTDESHSFDAFLKEAAYERAPYKGITGDTFVGYDALRGAYKFTIGGTGFNTPYFTAWNRHYTTDIKLNGGNEDRSFYIYTVCETNGGSTEGALLMDEDQLQIPIPTMIFKNFGGEKEEPIYYHGDKSYSETLFPVTINAKTRNVITVVNTMQNWGAFPLKQVSSISYYAPYYHLSTGVTETSCIAPWYVHGKSLWTLPDFRTMSGPWWYEYAGDLRDSQPQHTHAGYHYFLQYTDAEGNYYASENIYNNIDSSGQNYGEIRMDYISDDGKIKGTFNHIEFPQTDEHRAFYEITYEVLEDVSFKDFKNDFSFFSTKAYAGTYQKMGYLNEGNEIVHTDALTDRFTILGDNCPYVSFYELKGEWENKCGNTGFLIYNSDMTIGGEKYDGNFALLSKSKQHYLTLDLDEVTLKKGDKIIINMVIVPWGSEQSTDDSNMIRIRENTCLKPLTVNVTKGEKIESVFVPRVKTDDGKSAEFTLTGGYNNVAVRVYGFDKLTAPKLYEKIDGEWVEYVTASVANPDENGTYHYYDGYFAYYDGDGTYSYTFVANMTDAESRTFKIDASEDFTKWPEIQETEDDSPLNYYADAKKVESLIKGVAPVGDIILSDDGSYVRIHGNNDSGEAFFTCYTDIGSKPAGQYLVIKYRFDASAAESPDKSDFQIFTSTENNAAVAADNFYIRSLQRDGEWHVAIVDMTKQNLPTFKPNANGKYLPLHVRLDIFNTKTLTESYVDIGYIGISDNLEDICALNSDLVSGDMHEGGKLVGTLDFSTGEVKADETVTPTPTIDKVAADTLITADSNYKLSSERYIARIDFVNGVGDGQEGSPQYDGKGAAHSTSVDVLPYNGKTVEGSKLAIAGWTMVYGGIEKYVWSADGGKTWNDTTLLGRDSIGEAGAGIIGAANGSCGVTDMDRFTANTQFQGNADTPSGVCADLTDYVGQTVDVIFAAVPTSAPDSVCIIVVVGDVEVIAG